MQEGPGLNPGGEWWTF